MAGKYQKNTWGNISTRHLHMEVTEDDYGTDHRRPKHPVLEMKRALRR